MKITSQVALGTGSLVLLVAVTLAYTVGLLHRTAEGSRSLATDQLEISRQLQQQATALSQLRETTLKLVVSSPPARRSYGDRLHTLAQDFDSELMRLGGAPLAPMERRALERLRIAWVDLRGDQGLAALLQREAPTADPEAAVTRWHQRFDTLDPLVQEALGAHRRALDERAAATIANVQRAERSSWIAGLLALLFGCATVGLTVRSIRRPLAQLAAGTRAVAEGRFDVQFPVRRRDELAQLAESFNDMVEQLRHLEDMKKDFVARVSHELRNPLVSMQETNQLLLEEIAGPLNPRQQRLLRLNMESGRRLSALLTSLLDLSRLEAGVMTYDLRREDLGALAATALSELESRAQERSLRLRLELDSVEEWVFAVCDRERLLQVLVNLLDNAVRHSPRGGLVEVRVGRSPGSRREPHSVESAAAPRRRTPLPWSPGRRRQTQEWVGVSVSDGGPGVPTSQRRAIFRKFHRGHRPGDRRADGGVGLGLTICREIIDAHSGRLWVDDAPGGGARFWVMLPAAVAVAEAVRPAVRAAS